MLSPKRRGLTNVHEVEEKKKKIDANPWTV
jgi:hypothetical protein